MMSQYNYKFHEFEDLTKTLDSVIDEVHKHTKGGTIAADQLKEKLGNKLDMATMIVRLTNACTESKKLLSKLHSHNFDLRGKLADVSFDALNKISEDVRTKHTELKEEIEALPDKICKLQPEKKAESDKGDPKTYASIIGNSKSLVNPIKRAMKQLKEDDMRARNLVVHGLDINPSETWSSTERHENLKAQVQDVLARSTSGTSLVVRAGAEDMDILGKVDESGKAPPVLVKLKSEKETMHGLRCAKNLVKIREYRKVFISADLGVEEREKRRFLLLKLKEKISEFPEEHWIVRDGTVTSIVKHTPPQKLAFDEYAKSYEL